MPLDVPEPDEPRSVPPASAAENPRPDTGSVRPLVVFLAVAVLGLVSGIVFALVHLGNERELDRLADARADVVQAVHEGRAVHDSLIQQVAAAEKTLTATRGKVVSDSVRVTLAERVAAAKELGTVRPPAVPEAGTPGLDTPEDVDALEAAATEWVVTARTTSTTLASATEEVQASNQQWEQDRKEARAEARAAADAARKKVADLERAKTALSLVSAQLKISVRDSEYTLSWTADAGARDGVRATLTARRAEGQAALGAGADMENPRAVWKLAQRHETARAAIEAAAWAARATVADGSNGRLALNSLCKVGVGPEGQDQYLRCDAAEAWKELGTAFRAKFGKPLRVEYGYRPYDWQLQALDEFGSGQVAAPGTSNHGWALAVDVPVDDGFRFGHPEFDWLAANGPEAGWHHPGWARAGGGREEPWHFEYQG